MSKNIHKTPESELIDTQPVKLVSSKFDGFDKTMKLSIVALYALEGFFIMFEFFDPNQFGLTNLVLWTIYSIVAYVFIVYLIRVMRGNIIVAKNENDSDRYLSIWGYFWRVIFIKTSSQILTCLCLVITGLWKTIESPSSELTIVLAIFLVPTSAAAVWLFFSPDRKYQFQWFMTLIRGF